MRFKYIIFNSSFPAIFSESLSHNDIANGVRERPTSAGFIDFEIGGAFDDLIRVNCFGESFTLNIKSNQELDETIIENLINKENY
jgi:hypothetical protein